MIYYINIVLIAIVMFLIAKMYNIREGHINELNRPPTGIPNVPSDSLCLVSGLIGMPVNQYGALSNHCAFAKNNTQPDTSNTCTS
jgi:hypothetical protein